MTSELASWLAHLVGNGVRKLVRRQTTPDNIEHKIDRLDQQATELLERKEYQQAIPLATEASDLAREFLSPYDPTLATSLNNLAELYKGIGNYTEAERLYEQAIEIYRTPVTRII